MYGDFILEVDRSSSEYWDKIELTGYLVFCIERNDITVLNHLLDGPYTCQKI